MRHGILVDIQILISSKMAATAPFFVHEIQINIKNIQTITELEILVLEKCFLNITKRIE